MTSSLIPVNWNGIVPVIWPFAFVCKRSTGSSMTFTPNLVLKNAFVSVVADVDLAPLNASRPLAMNTFLPASSMELTCEIIAGFVPNAPLDP